MKTLKVEAVYSMAYETLEDTTCGSAQVHRPSLQCSPPSLSTGISEPRSVRGFTSSEHGQNRCLIMSTQRGALQMFRIAAPGRRRIYWQDTRVQIQGPEDPLFAPSVHHKRAAIGPSSWKSLLEGVRKDYGQCSEGRNRLLCGGPIAMRRCWSRRRTSAVDLRERTRCGTCRTTASRP